MLDLTEQGCQEARSGGQLLRDKGYTFDIAYTSVLKRAIRTLNIIQEEMDLEWIPVFRAWQLNERHYGALQGLNKSEMAVKFGEEQVKIWRRSYDVPPPALELNDERHPRFDRRYAELTPAQTPCDRIAQDHSGASSSLLAQHPCTYDQIRKACANCCPR